MTPERELRKFTVKDLKQMLRDAGIRGYSKLRKNQLIAKLVENKVDFSSYTSSKKKRVLTDDKKKEMVERMRRGRERKRNARREPTRENVVSPRLDVVEDKHLETHKYTEPQQPTQLDTIKVVKKTNEEKEELKNETKELKKIVKQIELPKIKNVDTKGLLMGVLDCLNNEQMKVIFSNRQTAKDIKRLILNNRDNRPMDVAKKIDTFLRRARRREQINITEQRLNTIKECLEKLKS